MTNESDGRETRRRGANPQTTIHDVARLAKVSIGTVSKALNRGGRLKPETRERVIAAAKQLAFRPNDLAQSLHRGHSLTVGLISKDNFGRFAMPIMEGLEECMADQSIAVFMCNATDDPEREAHHVRSLLGKRVDGIVVTARRADRRPPLGVAAAGPPVLYVFSQTEDPDALCLLPDDEGGAFMATEHLMKLGRRRLAHVTGPEHFEAVRLRRQGYRAALRACGLSAPDDYCLTGAWSEDWGRRALASLFDSGAAAPDGIVCGNDQIARGIADGLRERGIGVPDVGVDRWLRQLADSRRGDAAGADHHRHESERTWPRSRATVDGNDRRRPPEGRAATAMQPDRAPILRRERAELNLELIEGKAIMRKYTPAPFAAVDFGEGFWHERLETVLTRTIPSQYEQLQRHGILEFDESAETGAAAAHPGQQSRHVDAGLLGFGRRQMDRSGELRAFAPARCDHRGADRGDHRLARPDPARRRLSQLLVYRAGDRQALDQSARPARALLRRPHDRGRRRLFPGDRPAPAARHFLPLCRPHRRDLRPRSRPETRLLRASRNRARADQAAPCDRQSSPSRPRRLFRRRARQSEPALFRCRGGRSRRRSRKILVQHA